MTQNQVAYWSLIENTRANQAKESETARNNAAVEAETQRHNRAMELSNFNAVQEAIAHNRRQEEIERARNAEAERNNRMREHLSELDSQRRFSASRFASAQSARVAAMKAATDMEIAQIRDRRAASEARLHEIQANLDRMQRERESKRRETFDNRTIRERRNERMSRAFTEAAKIQQSGDNARLSSGVELVGQAIKLVGLIGQTAPKIRAMLRPKPR